MKDLEEQIDQAVMALETEQRKRHESEVLADRLNVAAEEMREQLSKMERELMSAKVRRKITVMT